MSYMDKLIDQCNKTADIATIVHMLFKSEYWYKSNSNTWHSYDGDSWVLCDNAYSLRKRLSDVIAHMFASRAQYWRNRNDNDLIYNLDMVDKLYTYSILLKDNHFTNKIIKDCELLFIQ